MISPIRKYLPWLLLTAVVLLWHRLLPVVLPFLLGAGVAYAAEPLTARLSRRLPRPAASGVAVTLTLAALLALLILLLSSLVRLLTALAGQVPQLLDAAQGSLRSLRTTLVELSDRAPHSLRQPLRQGLDGLFSNGGTLVENAIAQVPNAAASLVGVVTDSFLALGTGCIAAYMLSSRLPGLRARLQSPPEGSWLARVLPRLRRIRHALWCWLKAQGKLSCISFLILLAGLLLLGIPWAPLWAFLIALVDAVPLLGTGAVLIPWALVSLLQARPVEALGLFAIYLTAALTRSVMEPRLVGKQLGLDPLITLGAIYAGYRFWGFGGILLAPILCVVVKEAVAGAKK